MYFTKLSIFGNSEQRQLRKSVFFGICLAYMSGSISTSTAADVADAYSRNVPLSPEIKQSSSLPVSGAAVPSYSYSEDALSLPSQRSHAHNHHHKHHHPTYNHKPEAPSPATEAYSRSWYATHISDPRMGFFFSDSIPPSVQTTSSTSDMTEGKQKQAPLVARPRSLPGFSTVVKREIKYEGDEKKKRKKQKDKKGKQIPTSPASPTKNNTTASPATKDLTPTESNRTFVFTPLALASLVPIFFAQLFGMGMIPAAALITFPIFLLPIGLAAAVFLV